MRYDVEIDGRVHEVVLDSCADGPVHATIDGEACEAEVTTEGQGLRIRFGPRVLEIHPEWRREGLVLHGRGGSVTVKTRGERDAAKAAVADRAAGPTSVRAPMPGRVVAILVEKGATVAAGAPIAVVEAMKMENELRAPSAGTVLEVRVRAGQNVEGGEELVRIG